MEQPSPPRESGNWLSDWFWSLTPHCREVTRLLSQERDLSLPLSTRIRLRIHRCACVYCDRYARQLGLISRMSKELPEALDNPTGPKLSPEARARLREALDNSTENPR